MPLPDPRAVPLYGGEEGEGKLSSISTIGYHQRVSNLKAKLAQWKENLKNVLSGAVPVIGQM